MTYKACSNKDKPRRDNKNIDSVKYPFDEKLILDNDNVAIVTRETDSHIRMGLVRNTTVDTEDTIQADSTFVCK